MASITALITLTQAQAWAADEDQRKAPETPRAWRWSIVYKADLLTGSPTHHVAAMDNFDLQVDLDLDGLFGWTATALHAEVLSNHGSKLNRRVGTAQGISNIEVAQSATRLYATWVEHQFDVTRTRVLFGLYDLNSEFYATDASGMLIQPSFGMGIDFSQTGRNGPSIFPNLGLAVRVRQPVSIGGYVQAAAIDAAPGDPQRPGRTVLHLGAVDGVLLVGEAGWQSQGENRAGQGHWGFGAWQYSRTTPALDGGPPQKNHGAYALAQGVIAGGGAGRTIGFVRAGRASRRVNAVDMAAQSGLLFEYPFGAYGPRTITAGVAIAHLEQDARASGPSFSRKEIAFEVDGQWQAMPGFTLQPLLQRTKHPGGRPGSVTISGLRLEWALH